MIKIDKSVEAGVALWILVHALIQIVLLQSMFTCEKRKTRLRVFFSVVDFFFHLRIPNVFQIVTESFPMNHVPGQLHQVKGKILPGIEVDFQ